MCRAGKKNKKLGEKGKQEEGETKGDL